MNEAQRRELEEIRAEQQLLRAGLARLDRRLEQFDADSQVGSAMQPPALEKWESPVISAPLPASKPEVPPPLPPAVFPVKPLVVPPPVPSVPPTAPLPLAPLVEPMTPPSPPESLEMRIGTTWFVRVGIVLLVTSLAFLGNFLYHTIVPHLGPAAKVAALYVSAGAVMGVGAWLERSRQSRESGRVRQFSRIILAGGLAAVYYVTYAAHYYDRLRVIDSALLAGVLLLGWAAFMVWLAERRGSETLATVAILLGFYTSAINEGVAGFTLASNLFLAAGAAFLLRRHLWRVFPFASVLATFGSYAFWNYFHFYLGWRGLDTPPVHGGTRFWTECAFLLVYWLLFTWAAFTARDEALPSVRRAGFASLNNSAFFLLMTWLVLGERGADFWKWSLGFGAALIALSEGSRRLLRRLDTNTEGAYQLQGTLLVTLGFIAHFSGWQLSLMLAAQSVTLLAGAGQRRSRLLLSMACLSALLAFAWAENRLATPGGTAVWANGLGVGGFLLLGAWWSERLLEREGVGPTETGGVNFRRWLTPVPVYFSFLASAVWLWVMHNQITDARWAAPLLALAAVVLTASVYVLRVRAIPVFAQAFVAVAYARWFYNCGWSAVAPPWWNPSLLLAATLTLGHWWRRPEARKRIADYRWANFFPPLIAVGTVLVLHAWLEPLISSREQWIGVAAALSLALLGYGIVSRYRWLALAGQWLLIVSALRFAGQWHSFGYEGGGYDGRMWLTLGPWVGALATVIAAQRFLPAQEQKAAQLAQPVAAVYEVAAVVLFLAWAGEYFPHVVLFALYSLVGGGVFALGIWQRRSRWLWLGALPTVAGLMVFGLASLLGKPHGAVDLLGVACLVAQQWWGRRKIQPDEQLFPRAAQNTLITAAVASAWILVTHWIAPWRGGAFTLAAVWSVFAVAVFAAGLGLRERLYRWLGLVVLAITLLRVAVVDIWQLGSLERAVSAFVLSITLLGLGYLYNRYHDRWQNLL